MSHPRNPHSLLSTEMRQVLQAIAKAGRPPMAMLSAQQAKEAYALGAEVLEINAHKMVRDDTLHIPTRDGAQLRAKLCTVAGGNVQGFVARHFVGADFQNASA